MTDLERVIIGVATVLAVLAMVWLFGPPTFGFPW